MTVVICICGTIIIFNPHTRTTECAWCGRESIVDGPDEVDQPVNISWRTDEMSVSSDDDIDGSQMVPSWDIM